MTTAVHPSYPEAAEAVRGLVREHLKLKDEPLLLAIYYAPERDPLDIFLFEVIEGFGANAVDDRREIFEVSYSNRNNFPLQADQHLRLVLTNEPEFEKAAREGWPLLKELREAIRAKRYEVIHNAKPELLEKLT